MLALDEAGICPKLAASIGGRRFVATEVHQLPVYRRPLPFQLTGDICEMECAAESRVCHLLDTPFTAIKIISDVECSEEESGGPSRDELFMKFFTEKVGPKKLASALDALLANVSRVL